MQITSATLELGKELAAYFRCEGGLNEDWRSSRHEFPSAGLDSLADLLVINSCNVLPRSAKIDLKIEHEPPVLRGECYPLRIELVSLEKEDIINLQLTTTVGPASRIHDQPKIGTDTTVELTGNVIAAGGNQIWHVFFQTDQPGKHTINFQVNFPL